MIGTLFQGLAVADFVADVKIPDDVIQDGPPYTNYYVECKYKCNLCSCAYFI
jgi:hypothetical protein